MDTRVIVVSALDAEGERFFIMPPPQDWDLAKAWASVPTFTSSAEAKAWGRERWQEYLHTLRRLTEADARRELAQQGFAAGEIDEKIAKARRAREWDPQTDFEWSTRIGHRNANQQIVVAKTAAFGTRPFQRVYQLRCDNCGHEHTVEGCEIHGAECPKCPKGA